MLENERGLVMYYYSEQVLSTPGRGMLGAVILAPTSTSTYGTRRKYCNSQGTHGFRLPIGTSTGTRLGTDHTGCDWKARGCQTVLSK